MEVFYDEGCEYELSSAESVVDAFRPASSVVGERSYAEVLMGRSSKEGWSSSDEGSYVDDGFELVKSKHARRRDRYALESEMASNHTPWESGLLDNEDSVGIECANDDEKDDDTSSEKDPLKHQSAGGPEAEEPSTEVTSPKKAVGKWRKETLPSGRKVVAKRKAEEEAS